MEPKKLYRSRRSRMLCGVCGGIAEYFNIDPTLIRLGMVLFAFAGGTGILAYFVAAVIIPDEPKEY
ncbi:MAG: PspC domain-containing protein [Lachnospiraceae bacterium]